MIGLEQYWKAEHLNQNEQTVRNIIDGDENCFSYSIEQI